jgi:hypothetical protein
MYDTTNLDEIIMIAFLAIPVIYLAVKGELFRNW